METLPPDSIDCIWTDPPYLLSNDGITCVAGRMVKVNKGEWDRSRGVDLDHEFNRTWLAACRRVLKPSGTIWVSGTLHVYLSVGMAMQQLGFRILNDIVWEKPAPPPNLGCRCFTHSTEILLWATKAEKGSKNRHTFNYDAMKEENGGKQMKNVWRFSTPSADEKRYGKHPTQKPVALIARCLRASTNAGDLVLDPFAGSGSTGVAALALRRGFIGCEQDPDYAMLAARRLKVQEGGVV
jgi:site-specific DNA-methyltransferase (adenine-specific)